MGALSRPEWLSRDLGFLLGARALRSLALGFLGIILPIYLADLGYTTTAMGILFAVSAVVGALMAAAVGLLADRFGRKPFLVIISLLMAAGSVVFALSNNFTVMVGSAAISTIGFVGAPGLGGGWGPYYPAAQSLVAEQAAHYHRTTVFGVLSFVGVIAGSAGSALAILPGLFNRLYGLPIVAGYRQLFILSGVLGLAMAIIVLPIHELPRSAEAVENKMPAGTRRVRVAAESPSQAGGRTLGITHATWRLLVRFMITNATNGLAIGMLGPFVVYWFYRQFGASAAEIAKLYSVIGLIAAAPYLLAGPLTRRFGSVSTVVLTRAISAVLLLVMGVMPTFALAALVYTVRMTVNVLSIPVRQSYLMGVIEPSERASAAGLANLPAQGTRALSSYFAGYVMQHLALSMPIELAGALQAVNAYLYHRFFRDVRPPEEYFTVGEADTEVSELRTAE
ncbi:MAG TPA: MFS transporter [Candidatus Binataceae bacterium]|nr:MFS transporter [Candidatus Binataceae bacterium]